MNLAKNIPKDLADFFQAMVTDFPEILPENLVEIYLWGSLTYDAFDERYSDVDCIVVTARDLDEHEFSETDQWFEEQGQHNHWVKRIDMRFVIDGEFLDKTSRCCGFYHSTGKLVRHGSDGNPIVWINICPVRRQVVWQEREAHRTACVQSMPKRGTRARTGLPSGRPKLQRWGSIR